MTPDAKQTPVIYGAFTNSFQIADLSALLHAKKAASPENEAYKDAEYLYAQPLSIKSLPDFRKEKGHHVPKTVDSYTKGFVERYAAPRIAERVKTRYTQIKDHFGFLRKEIDQQEDRVMTKDFEYAIWAEQDEEEPSDAIIYEMLSNVSPEVLLDDDLNSLFGKTFDEMRVTLPKSIDVEQVIDRIEALKSADITVAYEADCEQCEISVSGGVRLQVSATSITVLSSKKTSPRGLVESLKDVQIKIAQIAGPVPFLLL